MQGISARRPFHADVGSVAVVTGVGRAAHDHVADPLHRERTLRKRAIPGAALGTAVPEPASLAAVGLVMAITNQIGSFVKAAHSMGFRIWHAGGVLGY